MAFYRFGEQVVSSDQIGFEKLLESFYGIQEAERPVCQCKEPGGPMYIACVGGKYIIKRMPNTGGLHTLDCESYEPLDIYSGQGDVEGTAISHHQDGTVTLKFDFALTLRSGRKAPPPATSEGGSVKRKAKGLTLRGYLDCLWDEAQLNKWHPGMMGKRSWRLIYRLLSHAAEAQQNKGNPLSDVLYMPEPWDSAHKDAIEARLMARIQPFSSSSNAGRNLMLVIGEYKHFSPTANGQMLVLKHLPTYAFLLNRDDFNSVEKKYKWAFDLHKATNDKERVEAHKAGHLMVAATVSISEVHIATVEEIAVQYYDEHWIPIDDALEMKMANLLVEKGRSFVKLLRYNRDRSTPMPLFHLLDSEQPFNIYIEPRNPSEEFKRDLQQWLSNDKSAFAVWRSGEGEYPELPSRRTQKSNTTQSGSGHAKQRSVIDARKIDRESPADEHVSPDTVLVN